MSGPTTPRWPQSVPSRVTKYSHPCSQGSTWECAFPRSCASSRKRGAYLPYRDPETLKAFLKIIDEFRYDHSERLGDAFEYYERR